MISARSSSFGFRTSAYFAGPDRARDRFPPRPRGRMYRGSRKVRRRLAAAAYEVDASAALAATTRFRPAPLAAYSATSAA